MGGTVNKCKPVVFTNFIPPAGLEGQHLAKKSDATWDMEWVDAVPDKHFAFSQAVPSDTWVIEHLMVKRPSVTVVDAGGNEIDGCVIHIDDNNLTITFNAPFSGIAYLN